MDVVKLEVNKFAIKYYLFSTIIHVIIFISCQIKIKTIYIYIYNNHKHNAITAIFQCYLFEFFDCFDDVEVAFKEEVEDMEEEVEECDDKEAGGKNCAVGTKLKAS